MWVAVVADFFAKKIFQIHVKGKHVVALSLGLSEFRHALGLSEFRYALGLSENSPKR